MTDARKYARETTEVLNRQQVALCEQSNNIRVMRKRDCTNTRAVAHTDLYPRMVETAFDGESLSVET